MKTDVNETQHDRHDHHDHAGHHHHGTENIKVAFWLNLAFSILEIFGGIWTNSLAILSDALHDLGDSLSIGLAWYLQNVSKKESNSSFSYGFKRFSLLGALINAIILTIGSLVILWYALPRLWNPGTVDAGGMMLLALLGVVVNGAAFIRLKNGLSLNEEVLSLHLLEDVLGWVAVLVGAIVMYFTDAPWIDPILSIAIALFILYNVYRSLNKVIKVLLQAVPENLDIKIIGNHLREYAEIHDFHDLHAWSLDGRYTILTAHIVLENPLDFEQMSALKQKVRTALQAQNVDHITMEFELKGEECIFKFGC